MPLALIAWLLWTNRAEIDQFRRQSIDFVLLTVALAAVFLSLCITIFRWYLLVRALEIDFRIRDSFRLGFLTYLFNFISPGSVGGDLFKAVFIAREQPGRRIDAVATIFIDRLFGLYALLLIASTALAIVETSGTEATAPERTVIFALTLIATLAIPLVLLVGLTSERAVKLFEQIPFAGKVIQQMLAIVRRYTRRPNVLIVSLVLSLAGQCCGALSLYFTARAIFDDIPSITDHFYIMPLADIAKALPLFPSGFGQFEVALQKLYEAVPDTEIGDAAIVIAIAQRLMEIIIAAVGAVFYIFCRREVADVMGAAKKIQSEEAKS